MKVAVISLVLLGVLAAGSAVTLVSAIAARSEARTPTTGPSEQQVEVLVAARDLLPMGVVDTSAVTKKLVPKSQVPQGALLNPVQVVGKVVTDRMVAEQPFTKACFAREGTGVYLAAAVPPGKRAMSVQLTDWSGMAGLLYPGSVVDVLVSFKALDGTSKSDEMMATTLLQGLQVLAIGSQSIADEQYQDKNPGAMASHGQINMRMVTLLVDPKQAEILQLAMQNGAISLSMRNPLDAAKEAQRLTRAREIAPSRIGYAVAAADPFREPAKSKVEEKQPTTKPADDPKLWETMIIRGNTSERRTFPMPAETDAQMSRAVQSKLAG
jgi:pilus assembly protein CpaB